MPVIISGSQGTTIISGSGVASVSGSDGVRTYISSSQSGKVDITGSLTVSGSNTITNYGAFTSNEAGGDFDFRVESSGEPNMLFVDGGANRVGIGTQAPGASLHVSSSGDAALFRVDGLASGSAIFVTSSLLSNVNNGSNAPLSGAALGIGTTNPEYIIDTGYNIQNARIGNLELGCLPSYRVYNNVGYCYVGHAALNHGVSTYALSQNANGVTSLNSYSVYGNADLYFRINGLVKAAIDSNGNFGIGPNAGASWTPNSLLHVSGSPGALFQIDATSGSVPSANAPILFVTGGAVGRVGIGTQTPSKTLSVIGEISGSSLFHAQGAATLASTLDVSGAFTANGGAVFNENSADLDFRVETNGNANTIFAEGSTDFVGIRTAAPKVALDVHHDPTGLGNDTGGGEVVYFGSSSAGLTAGALYYLNSAGGWMSASAEATGSGVNQPGGYSQMLGISLGTTIGTHGMLIRGFYDANTFLSGAFIKGAPIYVCSSSKGDHYGAGFVTGSAPTGGNAFVRVVGYATDTANVIYFNPGSTYVEIEPEGH